MAGIGSKLETVAACALGLTLALCLAGLAGLLVAGILGFVMGGGLIISGAVVRGALERAGYPVNGTETRAGRHGSNGARPRQSK